MKRIFTSLLCGLMTTAAFAQWSPTSMQGEKIRTASNVKTYYSLDLNAMRSKLANAQETGSNAVPVEIKLPTLNGKIERFAVYSSPVVVKSIADRYQLGSYVGVGIDDPTAIVRFSVAPNDFQSMIVRNGNYEFIEPQNASKTVYGVHPKTNKTE
ncbi:MAG: propanediol utilization protein, partial [Kaistella sp.]|nr:propanediol utilization protein [Kaistella sp.]